MEYEAYKELMRPLFAADDWGGLNRILESTGPDYFPGPAEARTAFKAFIDLGMELGHDTDTLDGKLSEVPRKILQALIMAQQQSPLQEILALLSQATGGAINMDDMSAHRATEELCRSCESDTCTSRLAPFAKTVDITIQ